MNMPGRKGYKHIGVFKMAVFLFFLHAAYSFSQNYLDFNSAAKKDENTWNFFSNLNGQYELSSLSKIRLSNIFVSRFLLARDSWQRDNRLVFMYKHTYSSHLNFDAGLNSRVITNEEAFQKFSQHTIDIKPDIIISSDISISPAGGAGVAVQKTHKDFGLTYGLDSRGNILKDESETAGYSFTSNFEDFGARQNRRYDVSVFWNQNFSPYSSDSLSVGFFYNYNENYLAAENNEVESFGKQNRFVRNNLFYKVSEFLKGRLQTSYEWKNLDRISSYLSDARTEYALENRVYLIYKNDDNSITGNIRFRNEQKRGQNTAINTDTRLTSMQITGSHKPWDAHIFKYNLYLSKYETDTPKVQEQDRDELRWAIFGSYNWLISKSLGFLLQGEVTNSHQTYLFARYSSNNYENRLFRIKSGVSVKPLKKLKNTLIFGIDTNYNIFDFEEFDEVLRSNLVKTWTLSDTLQYYFSERTAISYILMLNNVFVGNFDPQEILFYRNQDRIINQHEFRFNYSFPPSFSLMLGGVIYNFAQIDPTNNYFVQSRQNNFTPQLELIYKSGNKIRLRVLAQLHNGKVTYYGTEKIVTDRIFSKFDINFDYLF